MEASCKLLASFAHLEDMMFDKAQQHRPSPSEKEKG